MSKAFTTLFLLLLTALSTEAQDTLRIMSYNIRNCKGLDNIHDIQRTANVIRKNATIANSLFFILIINPIYPIAEC